MIYRRASLGAREQHWTSQLRMPLMDKLSKLEAPVRTRFPAFGGLAVFVAVC